MIPVLAQYFAYHQAKGSSPATIKSYKYHLEIYERWLGDRRWDVSENVIGWLAHRRELELSDYTIRSHYRALSAFVTWCLSRKPPIIAESPLEGVPRPVVRPKVPKRTTHYQFEDLLESIECRRWVDYRDIAVLHVLYWSALRVGELVKLRIYNVDLHEQLLRVDGKGGEHLVAMPPDAIVALEMYLRQRPECETSALWIKDDGMGRPNGVISAEGVRQMLKRRCERAGVPVANPHSFRHGFAMDALNAGTDMTVVSKQLGHSSTATTERHYAQHTSSSLVQRINEAAVRIKRASDTKN